MKLIGLCHFLLRLALDLSFCSIDLCYKKVNYKELSRSIQFSIGKIELALFRISSPTWDVHHSCRLIKYELIVTYLTVKFYIKSIWYDNIDVIFVFPSGKIIQSNTESCGKGYKSRLCTQHQLTVAHFAIARKMLTLSRNLIRSLPRPHIYESTHMDILSLLILICSRKWQETYTLPFHKTLTICSLPPPVLPITSMP